MPAYCRPMAAQMFCKACMAFAPSTAGMSGIQLTVDEHYPEFARVAVLAARVQILDGEQFVRRRDARGLRSNRG